MTKRKPLTVEQRQRKIAKDRERRARLKAAKHDGAAEPSPSRRSAQPQGRLARFLAILGIELR